MDALTDRLREIESNAFAELSTDVDLQEIQRVDQYNDPIIEVNDKVPTQDFNLDESTATATTESIGIMEPPLRRQPSAFLTDDESEPVPHTRIIDLEPSKFKFALGLWCNHVGISRTQYSSLREILRMLEPNAEVSRLPESLTTLKRHTKGQLPLLSLRKKAIPLIPEKLASETATRKAQGHAYALPREDLYFFDPKVMFARFLASDITKNMHFGMAEWHDDTPTELWHSFSWASSIRTTSGEYAHYPATGYPIFPSDFVAFRCADLECSCHDVQINSPDMHIGRVHSVARNYRVDADKPGAVTLAIQEGTRYNHLPPWFVPVPQMLANELILTLTLYYVLEEQIQGQVQVMLDYQYDDGKTKIGPLRPAPNQLFVRRVVDDMEKPNPAMRSICHTNPLRAELELKTYGRQHFVDMDIKYSKLPCRSVPLLTFIDGFGLYRNSYRSLMGMYLIMASLSFQDRTRRANVLPLTLGPHGSNFSDVVDALQLMAELDGGVEMMINGERVQVMVFTHYYIGDMPQQQENAGFKTQRAKKDKMPYLKQ
jgi:hypothetical protein